MWATIVLALFGILLSLIVRNLTKNRLFIVLSFAVAVVAYYYFISIILNFLINPSIDLFFVTTSTYLFFFFGFTVVPDKKLLIFVLATFLIILASNPLLQSAVTHIQQQRVTNVEGEIVYAAIRGGVERSDRVVLASLNGMNRKTVFSSHTEDSLAPLFGENGDIKFIGLSEIDGWSMYTVSAHQTGNIKKEPFNYNYNKETDKFSGFRVNEFTDIGKDLKLEKGSLYALIQSQWVPLFIQNNYDTKFNKGVERIKSHCDGKIVIFSTHGASIFLADLRNSKPVVIFVDKGQYFDTRNVECK